MFQHVDLTEEDEFVVFFQPFSQLDEEIHRDRNCRARHVHIAQFWVAGDYVGCELRQASLTLN